MNLTWTAIRSINGSQAEGFEKLCVQLADAEKPDDASFVPKGKPDAGVECYCILADGSEWGWQAKYFLHALGPTQWKQIDDSVKTALDKHPKLVRYFLCVPLDLSDTRISGQKSDLDRWNDHVAKWEEWARERGRCVKFFWWGEHKLLDILSKTEHIGHRHFWFNERYFGSDWFQKHLDEAIADAGPPRYTPEAHTELSIADELMPFGHMEYAADMLLTVATIDGHPFNAEFLDRRLRQFSMPDRDAWWSTSLYRLWEEHRQLGKQNAVDYLVHWAWTSPSRGNSDETTVELCAIALAWMLATSHRFLRDRATKALVALLTGRLEATVKWVERFSDVDDLYIAERIYAVAYGVALRSHDAQGVGQLASQVYNQVFAHRPPPVHILLRDYARGVIERAAELGTEINVDMQRVRPPYRSAWPVIPTEQVIQHQLDGWREASTLEAGQGQEAGWRSIDSSLSAVGDFARYVIGVDRFLPSSSRWLSLRRGQATPLCGENAESIPRFDLKEIQRYVLQRVATLGWTQERFGCFDSGVARNSSGRQADKPERIGKKYQWIAYHEILAYLADHYQYRDGNQYAYSGPWQIGVRDIDPSCTSTVQPGTASTGNGYQPTWWEPQVYDGWDPEVSHQVWLEDASDFPSVPDSLMVSHPQRSNVKWLRARRYHVWPSSPLAGKDAYNDGYRELMIRTIGYLVPSTQIEHFQKWVQTTDFREEEIHDRFPVCGPAFLGEYGWSPAFRHHRRELDDDTEGLLLGRNCPVRVSSLAWNYASGFGGFDCSVDASYALELPDPEFVKQTGLCWTGTGADFVNEAGETVAFDPAAHEADPSALLIRADAMDQYLTMQDRVLCWIMMGEKSIRENTQFYGALKVRGVYTYRNGTIEGDYQIFPYASRQY